MRRGDIATRRGLGLLVCWCAPACSLLYSAPGEVAGVSCDEQVCTVESTIGSGPDRDFSTITAWEAARGGDLTSRALLIVTDTRGRFEPGEPVTGARSGCTGSYRPADEVLSNGRLLSLDQDSVSCRDGEEIVGAVTGARAAVDEVLGIGVIERGILYADGVFDENVVLEGSVTDSEHFLWLQAAPEHAHRGLEGGGVVLEPTTAGHAIDVLDDHARISGVEIRGWSPQPGSYDGIHIAADGVVVEHVLIHDDGAPAGSNPDANGITIEASDVSAVVRNAMIYDVARAGISIHQQANVALHVFNTTVVRCSLNDNIVYACIGRREGTNVEITAINSIAISPQRTFSPAVAGVFQWGSDSGFNVSSDSSAPGEGALHGVSAPDLFESAEAPVDLHLNGSAAAHGAGQNLSEHFSDDIDGEPRPSLGPWDIGADER